jgi:hypothetical protein
VTGKIKPAKIPDSGFVRKENRVQKKMQRIFFITPLPTQPELEQPGGGLFINFPE